MTAHTFCNVLVYPFVFNFTFIISFIHTIPIVLLKFSTCLARLLLEKTHQVGWLGETESIGYLTYRLAGE